MGEPRFDWDAIPLAYPMDTAALPMAWDELEASDGGQCRQSASGVLRRRRSTRLRLSRSGPRIEHDPAFPERINVNVAQIADDGIRLRTWERGAGLTLACGTGACATAVAAIVQKKATSPVRVTMKGGVADHRLGAGRADPHARRGDPCFHGRDRP